MREFKRKLKQVLVLALSVILIGNSVDLSGLMVSAESAQVQENVSGGDVESVSGGNVSGGDDILIGEKVTGSYVPDMEFPSNEELFAGYVDKTFYGGFNFFAIGGNTAGSRLTGDEKLAYDALVPLIKSVASGERASTEFTIGQGDGVNYLVDAEVTFTEPTESFDLSALVYSLMMDLPYEMYWYDKTKGITIAAWSQPDGTLLRLELSFKVAKDYQLTGEDVSTVVTDITKTGATTTAAATAKAIVENNKDESDYEKLVAYRDAICDATDYNYDALGADVSYGDPWQMIYVFDGNEDTKVVCEGYSKAFQYLCDMSAFTEDIACYIATGDMRKGTEGGGHMWNIVTMEDGKNYMVDVTNTDGNGVGNNGSLFLTGATGSIADGYTFSTAGGDYLYTYHENTTDTWGSGDDSILKLSATNYEAPAVEIPDSLVIGGSTVINAGVLTGVNSGSGWSYDSTTNTLTLSGGTITGTEDGISVTGDLNIHVTGDSTVNGTWGGICAEEKEGTENGSTMKITIEEGVCLTVVGEREMGIDSDGVLELSGGSMNVSGNDGIDAATKLTIKDVELTATGDCFGLWTSGVMEITDSTLSVTGANANGMLALDTLSINNSKITAVGSGDAIYGVEKVAIADSYVLATDNRTNEDYLFGLGSDSDKCITISGSQVEVNGMIVPEPEVEDSVVKSEGIMTVTGNATLMVDTTLDVPGRFEMSDGAVLTIPAGITLDVLNADVSLEGNNSIIVEEGGSFLHSHAVSNNICWICKQEMAVKLTGVAEKGYYLSFEEAYEAAEAGDTLTLLKDVTVPDAACPNDVFYMKKDLTLDLSGKTLDFGNNHLYIWWDTTVTIKNGAIKNTNEAYGIDYCGNLVLDKVDVINIALTGITALDDNASLTLIGGSIKGHVTSIDLKGELILKDNPKLDTTYKGAVIMVCSNDTKIIVADEIEGGSFYTIEYGDVDCIKDLIEGAEGITLKEEWFVSSSTQPFYTLVLNEEANTFSVMYNLIDKWVKLSDSAVSYLGQAQAPTVSVKISNFPIKVEGTDYTVSYQKDGKTVSEMKDAGEYSIVVTGIGDCVGTVQKTFEIKKVDINSVDVFVAEPEAKGLAQNEIEVPSGAFYTGEISWSPAPLASSYFWFNTAYTATVVLTADGNHQFTENTTYTGFDSATVGSDENGNSTLTMTKAYAATRKEVVSSVSMPSFDAKLSKYYATAEDICEKLPSYVKCVTETDTGKELDITWGVVGTFDATPGAKNTFRWTIKDESWEDFECDAALLANNTYEIENGDGLAVNNVGEDDEITYVYGETYDVSKLFTIDKNAGAASYEVVESSAAEAGAGTLSGTELTITKAGEITLKLTTAANGLYAASETYAVLTVNKAEREAYVEVENIFYGETLNVIVKGDPTGTSTVGAESYYKGTDTAGASYSSEAQPVNAGSYTVRVTLQETELYKEKVLETSFTIKKAVADLSDIKAQNEKLFESTLVSEVVLVSEKNTVEGTLALDGVTALTVGTEEYAYKFTPADTNNYETVTGKVKLTVLANTLEELKLTGSLEKTAYTYGEEFELKGVTVTAIYVNGDTKDVTSYVEYSRTLAVGQSEVELTYQGKSCKVSGISVAPMEIKAEDVVYVLGDELTYNGKEQTQTIKEITVKGQKLTYEVTNNKATDAGTYKMQVNAKGNFTGSVEIPWSIAKKDISDAVITLGEALTYNGEQQAQKVKSVSVDGMTLSTGDYYISGYMGIDAGDYTLTVSAAELCNFTGSATTEWSIAKKDISAVEVTVENMTYSGGEQVLSYRVGELDGLTVTYDASGYKATNVGDYQLTITGKGNFTGSVTKDWSIAPKDITGAEVVLSNSLTYTGKTQTQIIRSVVADGISLWVTDYEVSGNEAKDAGEYVLTITGKGNFAGTVKKSYTVAKAKAPVIADVEKYYVYSVGSEDKVVSIDLSELLPQGCVAGSYVLAENSAAYVLDGAVATDGKLTYKVANTASVGDTTTLAVTVTSQNYEDISIKVIIKITDKFITVLKAGSEVTVTGAKELTYGQKVSELVLTGANAVFVVDGTDTVVEGTLSWVAPDVVHSAGEATPFWKFVPKDTASYTEVSGNVSITVKKAVPSVNLPAVEVSTYHPEQTLADLTLVGNKGSHTVAGAVVDVDGSWSFKNGLTVPTVKNDGYIVVFTPVDTNNYEAVEKVLAVEVAKATPFVEAKPQAAAITYGQMLTDAAFTGGKAVYAEGSTITVEGSFTWKDADMAPVVADSEKTEYAVVFTPADADNYNTVTLPMTVKVAKAAKAPNMPVDTINAANSVTKVGQISLPADWSWVAADADIELEVGVPVSAMAVYVGADAGNYEMESVSITITRAEAPKSPTCTTLQSGVPFIRGNMCLFGWDVIGRFFAAAVSGETLEVDMNGAKVVPAVILESIKGRDVTAVFYMNDGLSWTVTGLSVTADKVSDLNLGVSTDSSTIPVSVINKVTGDRYSMNVTLDYSGEFGFTAILNVNVKAENEGRFANLFYYNPAYGSMQFVCADEINELGMAHLPFTHASEYVIVIDDTIMNGVFTSPKTGGGDLAWSFWWMLVLAAFAVYGGYAVSQKKRR